MSSESTVKGFKAYNPHLRLYNPRISKEEWAQHRSFIQQCRRLFMKPQMILDRLQAQHGFNPTLRQLQTAMRAWDADVALGIDQDLDHNMDVPHLHATPFQLVRDTQSSGMDIIPAGSVSTADIGSLRAETPNVLSNLPMQDLAKLGIEPVFSSRQISTTGVEHPSIPKIGDSNFGTHLADSEYEPKNLSALVEILEYRPGSSDLEFVAKFTDIVEGILLQLDYHPTLELSAEMAKLTGETRSHVTTATLFELYTKLGSSLEYVFKWLPSEFHQAGVFLDSLGLQLQKQPGVPSRSYDTFIALFIFTYILRDWVDESEALWGILELQDVAIIIAVSVRFVLTLASLNESSVTDASGAICWMRVLSTHAQTLCELDEESFLELALCYRSSVKHITPTARASYLPTQYRCGQLEKTIFQALARKKRIERQQIARLSLSSNYTPSVSMSWDQTANDLDPEHSYKGCMQLVQIDSHGAERGCSGVGEQKDDQKARDHPVQPFSYAESTHSSVSSGTRSFREFAAGLKLSNNRSQASIRTNMSRRSASTQQSWDFEKVTGLPKANAVPSTEVRMVWLL